MRGTTTLVRLTLSIIVLVGAALSAAPASAQVGEVQIKGKWWSGTGGGLVGANELKAKCKDVGGPQLLDISVTGQRTLTLHFHADCFIFADACETCAGGSPPATADFVFTGEEIVVLSRGGNPKPFRQFSGVITSPVFAEGSIQGSMSGKMKCGDPFDSATCKIEKGIITYSRYQPGPPENTKVFIGKYKAKYQ